MPILAALHLLLIAGGVTAAPVPGHQSPAKPQKKTQVDKKVDTLLRESVAAYKTAQTLSGTLTQRMGNDERTVVTTMKVELKRPYLSHIVTLSQQEIKSGKTESVHVDGDLTVSDGTNVWDYDKAANTYSKHAFHLPEGLVLLSNLTNLVSMFYRPESLDHLQFLPQMMQAFGGKPTLTTSYVGRKTIEGVNYDVIEATLKTYAGNLTEPFVNTFDFYIGPDKFLYRMISTVQMPKQFKSGSGSIINEEVLGNVQVNKPIPASEFTFVPPPGATLKSNK